MISLFRPGRFKHWLCARCFSLTAEWTITSLFYAFYRTVPYRLIKCARILQQKLFFWFKKKKRTNDSRSSLHSHSHTLFFYFQHVNKLKFQCAYLRVSHPKRKITLLVYSCLTCHSWINIMRRSRCLHGRAGDTKIIAIFSSSNVIKSKIKFRRLHL